MLLPTKVGAEVSTLLNYCCSSLAGIYRSISFSIAKTVDQLNVNDFEVATFYVNNSILSYQW